MNGADSIDDGVVTAQLVRRSYDPSVRVVVALVCALVLVFGALVWTLRVSFWPSFSWSAAYQQNRVRMSALASGLRPGDSFEATIAALATQDDLHVHRDVASNFDYISFRLFTGERPTKLRFGSIQDRNGGVLAVDLQVIVAADGDQIVGIGLRTRDSENQHPDGCSPDQVDPKYIDEWGRVVSYYP